MGTVAKKGDGNEEGEVGGGPTPGEGGHQRRPVVDSVWRPAAGHLLDQATQGHTDICSQ
jgi:hypothetical protein